VTPGMQVRLWFRAATQGERRTTILVTAAVAGLLLGSLVIRPDDAKTTVATRQAAGTQGRAAGTAGGSGIATDGGISGTDVGGAGSFAGGAGGTGGTSGGNTSGGDTGGGGGGPVTLTASDRGVSQTEIKIGFLVANVGGLDGAGFALDIREDTPEYAQALADHVNNTGGLQGRNVTVAVRKTDPTSQSDQAAACEAMVSDAQVFGVVDVGALADTPAFDCLATENQTPYIHNTIWGTDWLARSGGMEVGYPAAIDRIIQTWTRDLQAIGWFEGNPTVGIVGDKCVATKPMIDNVFKPALEQAGAGKVVIAEHDCDLQSVASQPPSFVPQFRTAGVTKVLFVANFVTVTVFMKTAESQLWRPQYSVSDWWQLTQDTSAKNYDPNQFDGAIAITSNGLLLPQSGVDPYAGAQLCSQIAVDAGLPALEFTTRNAELWAMCDNFLLMIDGIKGAGANPTRVAWAQAIQQLPTRSSVVFGPATFGPNKTTGSDQVFTAQWQRACTCFKKVSDFRPAAA